MLCAYRQSLEVLGNHADPIVNGTITVRGRADPIVECMIRFLCEVTRTLQWKVFETALCILFGRIECYYSKLCMLIRPRAGLLLVCLFVCLDVCLNVCLGTCVFEYYINISFYISEASSLTMYYYLVILVIFSSLASFIY